MKSPNDNLLKSDGQMSLNSTIKCAGETEPCPVELKSYMQLKLELAGLLRILRNDLTSLGRSNAEQKIKELMVNLAEDNFPVAIYSQDTKTGNLIINSIIGDQVLPEYEPLPPSVKTIIKYGPVKRLLLYYNNIAFPDELPVDCLSGSTAKEENPVFKKNVEKLIIELPVPFLRYGINLIVFPEIAFRDIFKSAAKGYLRPGYDASLFVADRDIFMSQYGLIFQHGIPETVSNILFIVTVTESATNLNPDKVYGNWDETLREQTGFNTIKFFPVHTSMGLIAKKSGNIDLYQESGLKNLEESLASFLSNLKLKTLITPVTDKALHVLEDEKNDGVFEDIDKIMNKMSTKEGQPVTVNRDPHASVISISGIRARLQTFRDHIQVDRPVVAEAKQVQSSSPTKISFKSSEPAETDIQADFQTRECPVCRYITKFTSNLFADWQYKLVTEEKTQMQFAETLGFCPVHTWQLFAMISPYGASVGFTRLGENVARRLRQLADEYNGHENVRKLVNDSDNCSVCMVIHEVEDKYIHHLAEIISKADMTSRYVHSQGVCLKHLAILLYAIDSGEYRKFLLLDAARRFDEDAEDMKTFTLKSDALRKALQNPDEEDAHMRAIARMISSQSMTMPQT